MGIVKSPGLTALVLRGKGFLGMLTAALALERIFRAAFTCAWSACPQAMQRKTLAMGGWPCRYAHMPNIPGSG